MFLYFLHLKFNPLCVVIRIFRIVCIYWWSVYIGGDDITEINGWLNPDVSHPVNSTSGWYERVI